MQYVGFDIILYSQVIRWLHIIEIIRFPQKTVIMMTVAFITVLNITKEPGGIMLVFIPIWMDCTMGKALHPTAWESIGNLGRGSCTPWEWLRWRSGEYSESLFRMLIACIIYSFHIYPCRLDHIETEMEMWSTYSTQKVTHLRWFIRS